VAGQIRNYRLISSPIRDKEGSIVAAIEMVEDVTERRRAEEEIIRLNQELKHNISQLENTNKELESFSYSVSHDLRSPLRSIDGFSQALLDDYSDKLDEEGRKYLQRVRNASQRMGQLIDDLLSLSRVSRREMRHELVDLSALANTLAADLGNMRPERRIAWNIQPGIFAPGDAGLLRILLENLLENAVKFTGKTENARIEFGRTDHRGEEAYSVRDNGAGFDMTYSGKLFGAFQRLHSQDEFPGTGIGLAIVQRIVNRHGGRIWAEGTVDKGAAFFFTLPSKGSE
jgi:light-regulated signal transduction histidine kinase (bacteriophytochrome)